MPEDGEVNQRAEEPQTARLSRGAFTLMTATKIKVPGAGGGGGETPRPGQGSPAAGSKRPGQRVEMEDTMGAVLQTPSGAS